MSVLSRELDSYQRAVDAYQRQLNSYNRGVQQYNDTLVRDADGNLLVIDSSGNVQKVDPEGKVTPGALPSGTLQDYGFSPIPDEDRFRMLRQGEPVESKREVRTNVIRSYDPESGYGGFSGGDGASSFGVDQLLSSGAEYGPEWRVDKAYRWMPIPDPSGKTSWFNQKYDYVEVDPSWLEANPLTYDAENGKPDIYTLSRNASVYAEKPDEWTKQFTRKAPDPTFAQVKRAGMPTLAQIEGGLIGEVMRGKGVRYGVPVYRPPGAEAGPAPGTPANAVEKPVPGTQVAPVKK